MSPRGSLAARFETKWTPEPNTGCWLWTAGCDRAGYGSIRLGGAGTRSRGAHRVSWQLHKGAVPAGLFVLHRCDQPACVNPDHLFLGTNQDNSDDKVAKRRQAKGATSRQTKIPDDVIPWIRRLRRVGLLQREIAALYEVDPSAISLILSGRRAVTREVGL